MVTTRRLIGERKPPGSVRPDEAVDTAQVLARAASEALKQSETIADMKATLAPACRAYYSLAATSRRRHLEPDVRERLLRAIFPVRVGIENAIEEKLHTIPGDDVLAVTASGAFFGASAQQGVGIRYALASCIPTVTCGGRCYAHDGRDREIHHLFRSVLNWHVGRRFEDGNDRRREVILEALAPSIAAATAQARAEAGTATESGYVRSPRIRFSHIGDMAATPTFSNALAHAIRSADSGVTCVAYTRHPWASRLDPTLFVVNFSIDGDGDPRLRHAPPTARVVCSAWDGVVARAAQVNFLEHHVEKTSLPSRSGKICPVTARHGEIASCDEARCDACFIDVDLKTTTA